MFKCQKVTEEGKELAGFYSTRQTALEAVEEYCAQRQLQFTLHEWNGATVGTVSKNGFEYNYVFVIREIEFDTTITIE